MGESQSPCSCKVGTVAATYGLDEIHAEIVEEWTADDGKSVRQLADDFNKRVLRASFRAGDRLPVDGEVANVYSVLSDDEATLGSKEQIREQLRRDSIPITDVENDWISHQTLYRHLTECLETTHEPARQSDREQVETWRDRFLALQNRSTQVTEQGIESLLNDDAVHIGSFDVLVETNILCEDCGEFYSIEEFLEQRACDCAERR